MVYKVRLIKGGYNIMRMVTLIAKNHKYVTEMVIDNIISIDVLTSKSGYFLYVVLARSTNGKTYTHNISAYKWDEIRILHQ